MGRKNIKIVEDVFERHNKKRKEEGLSWSNYMDRLVFEDGRTNGENTTVSQPDEMSVTLDATERTKIANEVQEKVETLMGQS